MRIDGKRVTLRRQYMGDIVTLNVPNSQIMRTIK